MSAPRVASVAAVVLALSVTLVGAASASNIALGEGAFMGESFGERDIQETIWFQGFLADDATGEPVNATYTVTARIYDAESGGSSVWGPESHVGTVISAGWFNIELGNVIGGLPAFDTPPYYLQLTIDSELLLPRLKLASVPTAFQSLGADNGLNLPYSGTYGGSGDAFSVTNTGMNRCGFFRINNPSSTAGALYGQHNGAGSAVMGWHDGSGPAIKGYANGDGLAGEFKGAVTISDSLAVEGLLFARNNVVVSDTLAVAEGFWFAKDPVAGYVLRCADSWGNAEWAPPNVIDLSKTSSYVSLEGGGVVHHTGAEVTLTVPGPGYIVVESRVLFEFDHSAGTVDRLRLQNSPSSTSFFGGGSDWFSWEESASLGDDPDLDRTAHVSNTFEIASSGTYTYYLIGQMTSGASAGDDLDDTEMRGIYYPYPIAARTASP